MDLRDRLDTDLIAAQGALQPLPGMGMRQDLVSIEQQIPPAGAVQSPRLDEIEIRQQGPHLGSVFDPTDEGTEARRVFVDHRRRFLALVVDEHVDEIATHEGHSVTADGAPAARVAVLRSAHFWPEKEPVILHDILQHTVQIRRHLGKIRVGGAQVIDEEADRLGRDPLIELANPFAVLLLPGGGLAQDFLRLLLQGLDLLAQPLLFVCREGVDFLLCEQRPGAHRHKQETRWRSPDLQTPQEGSLAKLAEQLFSTAGDCVVKCLALLAVAIRLESLGQGGTQLVDEAHHVPRQSPAEARRQTERNRGLGVAEAVHVAQIVRHAILGRPFVQVQTHRGMPS